MSDQSVYIGLYFETSGYLEYKVFFKPSNTYHLLHCKSFHPHYTFKDIDKLHIIRFYRNSSNKQNLNQAYPLL